MSNSRAKRLSFKNCMYFIKSNLQTQKIFVSFSLAVHLFISHNEEMKKYYLDSRSRGISYMKYVNGRLTELVIFCVETAY